MRRGKASNAVDSVLCNYFMLDKIDTMRGEEHIRQLCKEQLIDGIKAMYIR